MQSILLGFLVASLFGSLVYGLECGLGSGEESSEMRKIVNQCLRGGEDEKTAKEEDKNATDATTMPPAILNATVTPNVTSVTNATSPMSAATIAQIPTTTPISVLRRPNEEDDEEESTRSRYRRSENLTIEIDEEDMLSKLSGFENGTNAAGNCIVQCIFQGLGMAGDDGIPQHAKVSEVLLKNLYDRELRDFFQDSVDECFQVVGQDKANTCTFSGNLMTCLADKGRQNCADWPVGNLPFPHTFT